MGANNTILRAGSQGKNSTLNKAYYNHINNLFETLDEEILLRWETYELIIDELLKEGKKEILNEIKYRITDGEDPNDIIIEILDRYSDDMTSLIWFLKRRVEEYREDDYLRNFY